MALFQFLELVTAFTIYLTSCVFRFLCQLEQISGNFSGTDGEPSILIAETSYLDRVIDTYIDYSFRINFQRSVYTSIRLAGLATANTS